MLATFSAVAMALALALPQPVQVPGTGGDPWDLGDEIKDKRPEVKELVKKLDDHIGKRGKEDKEALELMDKFIAEFKQSGPKDRGAIVKVLDKCVKQKRKQTEEGAPDNVLHLGAAAALGRMGPESGKPLIGWIGHKQHKKDLVLRRQLILSLGMTKHEKGVEPLLKLLNDDKAVLQAAAAEALGEYHEFEEKDRKVIFEGLLKTLMRVRAILDQDQNETIEHDRWDVIQTPLTTSMKKLSGHDEDGAHAWQTWWNKNKRKDWDEAKG